MILRRRPELGVLAAFSLFYIAVIFPFAYFRHDDWQIISNSVLRLPDDWRFLFSDTLYDRGVATRWFMRPVFKALAFASYPVFGFWYAGWLLEVLAMNLAALWLTCKTLRDLGRGDGPVLIFAIIFCASVHWHLGTQAWIGSGLINGPQLLGCALSLWAFCRFSLAAEPARAAGWLTLSVAGCVLALGAKESSVLHVVLVALLSWRVDALQRTSLERRLTGIAALALVTGLYLAGRLSLPLNRDYEPAFNDTVLRDGAALIASITIPTLVLLWAAHRRVSLALVRRGAASLWPFAVLAGVSMAPYLGHLFFSANWFFYTGYGWALSLALWGGATSILPARCATGLGARPSHCC